MFLCKEKNCGEYPMGADYGGCLVKIHWHSVKLRFASA